MAGQKFWLAYDKQCFKLCNSFILQWRTNQIQNY
jgi:hypothetical protein